MKTRLMSSSATRKVCSGNLENWLYNNCLLYTSESQEGNWADCGGPMLIMDVYAASKAEVAQKRAEAYPNVDMAVFKILRCDGEMTEVTALV